MFYLVKIPKWIKYIYPKLTWSIPSNEKKIFLTFDDGPHPVHTPFVLQLLKQYNAKATFFCIGKNVKAYPEIYSQILSNGHAVGNHTQHHLNGKHSHVHAYVHDILQAEKFINTNLFRPPYGRISNNQVNSIMALPNSYKIIMWTILSADFDAQITKEKCLQHVIKNTKKGDIIVFHDSEKASENMKYALPLALEYFTKNNFICSKIEA